MVPRRGHRDADYSGTSTIRYWGVFDAGRNDGHQLARSPSPVPDISPIENYRPDSPYHELRQGKNWLDVDFQIRSASTSSDLEPVLGHDDPTTPVQSPLLGALESHEAIAPYSVSPQTSGSSSEESEEPIDAPDNRGQLSLFKACGTMYKSPMPRVVNLFCVVGNPKTPWKLIHLPRVIQSVGDLSITGSVTRIRSALQSALLSISAFCISNDHKNRQEVDKAAYWSNEAILLRGKAIQHLKLAVEHDFRPEAMPRYKDFLATMLSMISINVMSGDTASCALHLSGISQLIIYAKKWKKKYSIKAQALHRTFFYLQTIHQSTLVLGKENPSISEAGLELFSQPLVLATSGPTLRDDVVGDEMSPGSEETLRQMVTFQGIYGVPQSLLFILSKVIRLIHSLDKVRRADQSVTIPASMMLECDELEHEIMTWTAEALPEDHPIRTTSINAEIIRLTTHAFYNAIIVYFAQNIRLIGHHYLRQFVQEVLESIESIEDIKAQSKTLAAPLFWPAFIAASESFDEELQLRFRNWYRRVEVYGFECPRTGIEILVKIWQSGITKDLRTTSRWRGEMMKMQSVLMLT
ncbi:hypothetical protein PFICI_10780 [Pestalotiopsis fici W106-1]|uniref:Transcription factor domain-containing protein n=1 Tax=Pestalotiopsis fici (strain W106-1 / CGMCC3.15140) TaxID=1229662 RepID=W3WVN4_PESFW|nr:uncharacterized protein PFICI_10780 [Pestalotiopsis fici W106-1]ETS76906.1 hypothetical protein PFICI_10780 [Pestalotiopsis fici W106-1]